MFASVNYYFRWNGYNDEDYRRTVEEYTKLEMV